MKGQIWASPQRGLPVDSAKDSFSVTSITGETVQLYYSNSGVRTIDAGQVAGVAVEGKLAYDNILNSSGSMLGTKLDKSLSFTSTAFTSEVTPESLGITRQQFEATDDMTFAMRLSTLTNGMTNGQYVVDYRNGMLYGKKADNSTTLTATAYKVCATSVVVDSEFPAAAALTDDFSNPTTTSVAAMTMEWDGSKWDRGPGNSTDGLLVNLGTNNDVTATGNVAAAATDSGNPVKVGAKYNASAPTYTDGQRGDLQINASGHLKNQEQYAPTAEDNTSYTYYTTLRPIATAADPNSHANIMTVVNSTALEASHILKAAPGRFYYARVEIDSTATTGTYYVQLINSATLPADGAVTLLIAPIKVHHTNGTTSAVDIDRSMYGVYASAGIVVTVSTTQYTKTIITSNWMNAEGHVA